MKIKKTEVRVSDAVRIAAMNAKNVELLIKFGFFIVGVGGSLFALYFILGAIEGWINHSPELAERLIDKLHITWVIPTIISFVSTFGWILEKRRSKRAINKKGYFQRIVEKNDPGRLSSGLSKDGETPQEEMA